MSVEDGVIFNEDLLKKVLPGLEAYEKENELWAPISRFARFAVYSRLAPQLVEEPFLKIWCRLLLADRNKKQLLFPREHTKTSMAKAFVTFLLCEPVERLGGAQIRVAFCGETTEFAKRNVKAVRRALETNRWILSEYGHSKPSKELLKEWRESLGDSAVSTPEWRQDMFRTARCLKSEIKTGVAFEEGSCWAQGMDKSTTGFHMNLVILDDPIGEKSAKSPVRKEKALGVYFDLQSQVISTGLLLDVGTRHALDDLHNTIQEQYADLFDIEVYDCWHGAKELERDDFVRNERGEYECIHDLEDVEVFWAGYGQLEDDIRRGFPLPADERKALALSNLAAKQASIPPQRWANQYLNRCVAVEDQVFFDWMFKFYEPSNLPVRLSTYILTDSATGRDNRSSYRVVAAVSLDATDTAYIRAVEFGRWTPEDYINRIIQMSQRYGARKVLMEKVAWQESFKTVMEMKCRLMNIEKPIVQDVHGRSEISKIERIECLEPRLRNGKLLFDPSLKGMEQDRKDTWHEIKRQFGTVHELSATQGLLLDIPDAISDVDVLDKEGNRLCKPAKHRRVGNLTHTTMAEGAMQPLKDAREKPRKEQNSLWTQRKKQPSRKIWG